MGCQTGAGWGGKYRFAGNVAGCGTPPAAIQPICSYDIYLNYDYAGV